LDKNKQKDIEKFEALYSTKNTWDGLYNGRYITLTGDSSHTYRVKGNRIATIPFKSIPKCLYFSEFKPRDGRQVAMVDSLYEDKITAISGPGGSGKTLAALTWAFDQLFSKKRSKLIIAINPVEVRNIAQLGAYKGDKLDKLLSHNIGGILRSKVGTTEDILALIDNEVLVIDTIANLRGVEIKDSEILYVTEAQNLTVDNMKLIVERMSNNAKLIVEGDYKAQVDARIYEGYNNGMLSLIRAAISVDKFGYVDLKSVYRNQWSGVVERM
jgi:predicted ribonuclease YlaK